MVKCNLVKDILKEQCITDSLKPINDNFTTLNNSLTSITSMTLSISGGGVNRVNEGNGITILPLSASGTGNVEVNELICPPWHIDSSGIPLYNLNLPRTSQQTADQKSFIRGLKQITSNNPPMPGAETLRKTGGYFYLNYFPYNAYCGGVLLQDGRVFLTPYNSTAAIIYDPVTDTTSYPSGTYPGNASYAGGVLLADGRVFLTPFYGTNKAAIYNPHDDTLAFTPAIFPGALPFYQTCGCVLLADGRVLGVPIFSQFNSQTYIYDPKTNSISYTNATFPGNHAFTGGILLPDGRVFLVPWGISLPYFIPTNVPAYIYDPVQDIVLPVSTWPSFPDAVGFYGATLMADGRIYCVPTREVPESKWAYIYNPADNTCTKASGEFPIDNVPNNTNVKNFVSARLMADGRIFICPSSNSTARIYDPINDTLTIPSLTFTNYQTADAYVGAVSLSNGDVFLVPSSWNSEGVGRIFSYHHDKSFELNAITGSYINHY